MFSDHGKPGEQNAINLQFSIENTTVGLDWALLAPCLTCALRKVIS